MRKLAFSLALISSLCALGIAATALEGMSTSFSDVTMRDVPWGKTFVVPGPIGNGMELKNLGSTPLKVKIKTFLPTPNQLKAGAAPIPDPTWLKCKPDVLTIPAKGVGVVHLSLQIPSDDQYKGKTFQVMILSQSIPQSKGSLTLSTGMLSKLVFTTQK